MSIRKYKVTTEYKEYKEFIVSELEFLENKNLVKYKSIYKMSIIIKGCSLSWNKDFII